jgi:hypothetical protein
MIGKVIKSLLVTNIDLIALVPEDSIFPYVLNENTALPAIIYTINGLESDYTKDGWTWDDITFSVISLSDNYNTLQSIVYQVRTALELKYATVEGIVIEKIYLTGMDEGFNLVENVFMNRLTFTVKMNTY